MKYANTVVFDCYITGTVVLGKLRLSKYLALASLASHGPFALSENWR